MSNSKRVKRCLSQIISKEESIIEFATAKLSICSFNTLQFHPFDKEGILCVVANRNHSCLFLQLFDIIEFKKVFEIQLYSNVAQGYIVKSKLFHYIEFPGFYLGMSFAVIKDAQDKEIGGGLIQKAIISTSKFIDINPDFFFYAFNFDFSKEMKEIEKAREEVNKAEQASKGSKGSKGSKNAVINEENKKRENEINEKIEKLRENKRLFDAIEVVDDDDKRIFRLVEFHTLRVNMKLVKKIYKKNFSRFIGTQNIFLPNIKSHKCNNHFFDEEEDDDAETETTRGKFVEFNPNDFIDILNDDDQDDKRRQSLVNIRNKLVKPDEHKNDILRVTPLGNKTTGKPKK